MKSAAVPLILVSQTAKWVTDPAAVLVPSLVVVVHIPVQEQSWLDLKVQVLFHTLLHNLVMLLVALSTDSQTGVRGTQTTTRPILLQGLDNKEPTEVPVVLVLLLLFNLATLNSVQLNGLLVLRAVDLVRRHVEVLSVHHSMVVNRDETAVCVR